MLLERFLEEEQEAIGESLFGDHDVGLLLKNLLLLLQIILWEGKKQWVVEELLGE